MSKFEYPRLPRKEIIAVLAESQIASISEHDLTNPTSDFVSNLYAQLLIHIGSLQEDSGLLEFADLDQLENPDLHVDSVRMMSLFRKVREVIDAICPKMFVFTLRDLVKPDPDRTEFFVGAILNFCLYRDTKMNMIRPAVDELTALDEQRQELEAKILQWNAEISELNELRERETPDIKELETKIEELRQAIAARNKQQSSLQATIRKKRDVSKEMDEKISSAEFALVQSAQENASLRSKIVQSPDKLQRKLEEKKTALTEAKNAEKAAIQSFNEKTAILEVYSKASKKMNKHLKLMQTLQEQVNSAKQVEKDVKVLKAKNSDDGVLDKSLEAKLFELQGRVDQLEELLKQLQKERDVKCEEASKELNNVRSQMEYDHCGLEQRQREVEALVAEGDAINEKFNKEKESAAAKQQMLLRKCEEITKEVFQYSNATGQLLSRIEAGASE
ncbi:putative kinetochore protein Nuf2 [Helianthus annuus]|uniref:Kinetochore protein Nuf2 n=1 Tax=Helianthus annuus TaxID=4232 RepID=A0A251TIJ0_HELAN|nr:kinetochore protein NUF2 homolog [Helianthus annuus]KAF5786569.1 putative kinetochore protein Nuf2 [Helianthus annuus]KAJ0513951.1 putative kinetochore protein Nuf2 [Helianthus annuus]KAJ0521962.1 putative kinetochore protein Nuf2 [Helianthus annuus]KAJ0530081.1 putative kinetochore protein Nuf2 [Helianthus annuus]KAJ0696937.1 putative kinetochore protein Nuf2 [Helianthus annuus]